MFFRKISYTDGEDYNNSSYIGVLIVFLYLDDWFCFNRACYITLHSILKIFLKRPPAVDFITNRRIFER